MAIAPQRAEIGIRRHFTTEGVHPYDEVRWERRDARITNFRDGTVAFEQLGVEVPESWSVNATNILAQKYFRGTLGTAEREWSLKQVADRVVDTLTSWGIKDGYFVDDDEALTFNHELKYLVIHQRAAFNSPVWFNIGVAGVPQQGSACFILSVEDTMDSILNWYTEEGVIFKGGSGAGVNLSRIRSSHELLKGGGTASGPVSFMRGADASAGTIKSGGKTRRAAKMVILDSDHPDVEDFIWCKAIEERKARVLRDAGFDMDLDGSDSHSTQYQNANNSVRVTDEFMEAVIDGRDWNLTARTDGSVVRTVPARDLFRQIAHSAWECADPGLQYDTTINRWHTAPNAGRITGSNPCFPGSAKVHTDKGLIPFRELFERANNGETFGIYTHDATNPDEPSEQMLVTSPEAFMITGFNDIVRLRFDNGAELRCTPSHKIFTTNRGYVEARQLVFTDEVKLLDLEAPSVDADLVLPVSSDPADYWTKGDHDLPLCLPRDVVGGVRPLPGLARRGRFDLGEHRGRDLREPGGSRRDPSPPRRAPRLGQLRASHQAVGAGQRHGAASPGAAGVQAFHRGARGEAGEGSREDGAVVGRAGTGRDRGGLPARVVRRGRLCRRLDAEPLRRTGLELTGAAARRADAPQHLRHHEPALPDAWRIRTDGSFTYTGKDGDDEDGTGTPLPTTCASPRRPSSVSRSTSGSP